MYRSINLLGPLTGEYCKIEQNYQKWGGGGGGGNLRAILVRVCGPVFLKQTIYRFS